MHSGLQLPLPARSRLPSRKVEPLLSVSFQPVFVVGMNEHVSLLPLAFEAAEEFSGSRLTRLDRRNDGV